MEAIDFFCLTSRKPIAFLAGFLVFYASFAMAEPPTPAEFIEPGELVLTLSDQWLEPNPNFNKFSPPGKHQPIPDTLEEKSANIDCGMDSSPTDKFVPSGFGGECSFKYRY